MVLDRGLLGLPFLNEQEDRIVGQLAYLVAFIGPSFKIGDCRPPNLAESPDALRLANHSAGGESLKTSRTPGPFVSLLGCDLKFPSSNQRATDRVSEQLDRVRVETSADNLTDLRAGPQVPESMKQVP